MAAKLDRDEAAMHQTFSCSVKVTVRCLNCMTLLFDKNLENSLTVE
jgi:hypothetical protein